MRQGISATTATQIGEHPGLGRGEVESSSQRVCERESEERHFLPLGILNCAWLGEFGSSSPTRSHVEKHSVNSR